MLTQQENELLCLVEGDAPMGQIMRRHWLPACLSEEVAEPDGDPIRVRLLGEDLVAFRDTDGRVGVLDEMCPHRRASLVLGRNEECGLRCLYHGWKMDVEGNVLEMASEPAESKMVEKVKHKAYPTHEEAGFVWVYMGPADEQPEFTAPVFQPTPETKVSISKVIVDCNWAQILEGAIDSAHSSSLHSTDMVPARIGGAEANDKLWLRPSTDKAPRLQLQKTRFGFRYAALRRPITDAKTHDYVRTTLFIAPYTVQIPPNNLYDIAILHVPIDDTHTAFHFIAWGDEATTPDTESWRKFLGTQIGIDLDARFRKFRSRENNYWQDRRIMQLGTATPGSGASPTRTSPCGRPWAPSPTAPTTGWAPATWPSSSSAARWFRPPRPCSRVVRRSAPASRAFHITSSNLSRALCPRRPTGGSWVPLLRKPNSTKPSRTSSPSDRSASDRLNKTINE